MAKVRCKETRVDTFFGNLYNPTIMLKMLLLSYLWNVSERMIEVLSNDSLSIGLFLGLGADERPPDHSTLTLFKNRLVENAGLKAYEELFDEIIRIARVRGVKFGQLQVVDSVPLVADVNLGKDKQYFCGYKDQVSLNAGTELVSSVIPGHANDYDGHKLKKLVEKDLGKGVEVGVVAGDKGYDDGDNHYYLLNKGINSTIKLNSYRSWKKDRNKEGWVKLKQSQEYTDGLKERYKVERKFGEARKWHGYNRCHYIGFIRHAIQSYLTFMALNLKRLVKLLTGISFRGEAKAYAMSG